MTKSLVVIDDRSLRKAAFTKAEKLLKKLERLEGNLKTFHDTDQRLFQDWYELTFREDRKNIESLHDQYRELCRIHNWIIAIARQRDLSMPEAYAVFRDEDEFYKTGSPEDKRRIEEERKRRDEFILSEVEKENEFDEFDDFDHDDYFDDDDGPSIPPRTDEEEELFHSISQLTDKKLRKILKDRDAGMELLIQVSGLMRSIKDYALFFRVWDLAPKKLQTEFSRFFSETNGVSLKSVMEEMRAALEALKEFEIDEEDWEDENRDEEPEFEESFAWSTERPNASGRLSPEELEEIKLIYRKLVRKLHPDLQKTSDKAEWLKTMWLRVQDAYQTLDRKALETLQRLVDLRLRNLNSLSLSEILESQFWLEEELYRLESEIKGLKRSPAWGFSRKRSYEALKKKLARELAREHDQIASQIEDLRAQHEWLAFYAEKMEEMKAPRRRRATKHRARPARSKSSRARQIELEF